MRNKFLYLTLFAATILFTGCEENEVMPSYTTVSKSVTHTMATLKTSKSQPTTQEQISLTLTYVNSSAEPLKTIALRSKVGNGAYTEIQSWDVSQDPENEVQTKTIPFVTPAITDVTVIIEMVITSHKDLPQIKRVSISIK